MDTPAYLADGFKEALIGIGRQFNQDLAIYDYDKCVDILMSRDGMNREEALEWMEYCVLGAYVGPGTPVFLEKDENNG
jgi:hypothetical protein